MNLNYRLSEKFFLLNLRTYHKILKISPGAYIFQRPFLRSLFLEGLIFGGAYLQMEICVSKLSQPYVGSKFTVFALFYFVFEGLFEGNFPSTSPQGGIYLEGRFNHGFFALLVWGACIWRGLIINGRAYFQNFTVLRLKGDGDVKWVLRKLRPSKTKT